MIRIFAHGLTVGGSGMDEIINEIFGTIAEEAEKAKEGA